MSLSNLAERPKFTTAIQTAGYQELIKRALNDPARERRFIANIVSAVSTSADLQKCDPASILSGALLGEALNLSPSPQLGHFYLVPFKDKATFILGYKAYIQLAMRSGKYKKINVLEVKKGELVKYDPFNEEIEISIMQDELARETAETTGYYAMFEYQNGFKKILYWSKEKMERHALKYSAGYKAKKGYTFWEKDFDQMGLKTMIRQLISKWGIMSIEMMDAFQADENPINADGTPEFIQGDVISDMVDKDPNTINMDDIQ